MHPTETPLVLFARLEIAVERGDFVAASAAVAALEKLGIVVRYGRPESDRSPTEKAVANATR